MNGNDKILIVFCDEKYLPALEGKHSTTRKAVVDDLIEESCWGEEVAELSEFIGYLGTDEERLLAIREAFIKY